MKKYVFLIIILSSLSACRGGKATMASKKDNYIVNKYAEILQSQKTEIKNIKLYSFIDEWYGTKYKYGGLLKSGVDCSGFCNVLYNEVYNTQIQRTTSELFKKINKTNKKNLREGDFVFFDISSKKNSHVGIYLKNNRFVHASSSRGVVISSLENPYYKKAYTKGGRLR